MEIAQYKSLKYGGTIIFEKSDDNDDYASYIRTTEYVDVEFVPLDNQTVCKKEIDSLNQQKKDIQANTQLQLNELDARIGELLALPPG